MKSSQQYQHIHYNNYESNIEITERQENALQNTAQDGHNQTIHRNAKKSCQFI